MEPMYFLPSEIARMVLGYLQQENCKRAYNALLKESSHLGEYSSLLRKGLEYPTTVAGKTLTEMLQEYGHIKLRETRAMKCGQPASALWKQFDELVKVIKQQVSPKQLQQPHFKRGRHRLADRIVGIGRTVDSSNQVSLGRISSDVEDSQTQRAVSCSGTLSVTTCTTVVGTDTGPALSVCSAGHQQHGGQTQTGACTQIHSPARLAQAGGYTSSPKSCQKVSVAHLSHLRDAQRPQSDVTGCSPYHLSEDSVPPIGPGSCGFELQDAVTEDMSEPETSEITKSPMPEKGSENLDIHSAEIMNSVSDKCTDKSEASSSEPKVAPCEGQREEVRMEIVVGETGKEPRTPISVCQPVSQCENAIDSFEQAKALHRPSVGGNQGSTHPEFEVHGLSRLSGSAFNSLGHMSGLGTTTPVKQPLPDEPVHITPSKSCSFRTTDSTKGKTPRRKRFAPKRLSSGAADVSSLEVGGPPRPVCKVVEGSEEHKAGHNEDSVISHHEDSMDIPTLVEQLLENTELQRKLAENINRGRHLSCEPAEDKPGEMPQDRLDPVTPSKPSPTNRNSPLQSLEDILDIHEAQMTDTEMNGIINMTRSDPAFDALFQIFDNGSGQDDSYKGPGDSSLSFSSHIRMALEADKGKQQMETDIATATLVKLSERPPSDCDPVHNSSKGEAYQRLLDSGQFGGNGQPAQTSLDGSRESGQGMDSEQARESDTNLSDQQVMDCGLSNQINHSKDDQTNSSCYVGVGVSSVENCPKFLKSRESRQKVLQEGAKVQVKDVSCKDHVHTAELRGSAQKTRDREPSICAAGTSQMSAGESSCGVSAVSQSVLNRPALPSGVRHCMNRMWVDASSLEFCTASTADSRSSATQSDHSSLHGSSNNDMSLHATNPSAATTKQLQKGKKPLKSTKVQTKRSLSEPVVVVLAENNPVINATNDVNQVTKVSNCQKATDWGPKVLTADGKEQKKNNLHLAVDQSKKSQSPSQDKINLSNTAATLTHDTSCDLDQGHHCEVSSDPVLSSTPRRSSPKPGCGKFLERPSILHSPRCKLSSSYIPTAESMAAGSEQNMARSLVTLSKSNPALSTSTCSSTISPGLSALLQMAPRPPEREAVDRAQVIRTIVHTSQGPISGEFIVTRVHEQVNRTENSKDVDEPSAVMSSLKRASPTLVSTSVSDSEDGSNRISDETVEVPQRQAKPSVPVSVPSHCSNTRPTEIRSKRATSTAAKPFAKSSQPAIMSDVQVSAVAKYTETTGTKELSQASSKNPITEERASCTAELSKLSNSRPSGRRGVSKNSRKSSVKIGSVIKHTEASSSGAGKQGAGCTSVSKLRQSPRLREKSTLVSQGNMASTPVKRLDVSSSYFISPSSSSELQANSCVNTAPARNKVVASLTPEKVSPKDASRKLPSLDLDAPRHTYSNVGPRGNALKITMKKQPIVRFSKRIQTMSVSECLTSANSGRNRKSGRQPREVHLQVAPVCKFPPPVKQMPVGFLACSGPFPQQQFTKVVNLAVRVSDTNLQHNARMQQTLSSPQLRMMPCTGCPSDTPVPLLSSQSAVAEALATPGKTSGPEVAAAAAGRVLRTRSPSSDNTVSCQAALFVKLKEKEAQNGQPNPAPSPVEYQRRPGSYGDGHPDLTVVDLSQCNEDKQTKLGSVPNKKRKKGGVRKPKQATSQEAQAKKSKLDVDLSKIEVEKLLSFVHKN